MNSNSRKMMLHSLAVSMALLHVCLVKHASAMHNSRMEPASADDTGFRQAWRVLNRGKTTRKLSACTECRRPANQKNTGLCTHCYQCKINFTKHGLRLTTAQIRQNFARRNKIRNKLRVRKILYKQHQKKIHKKKTVKGPGILINGPDSQTGSDHRTLSIRSDESDDDFFVNAADDTGLPTPKLSDKRERAARHYSSCETTIRHGHSIARKRSQAPSTCKRGLSPRSKGPEKKVRRLTRDAQTKSPAKKPSANEPPISGPKPKKSSKGKDVHVKPTPKARRRNDDSKTERRRRLLDRLHISEKRGRAC